MLVLHSLNFPPPFFIEVFGLGMLSFALKRIFRSYRAWTFLLILMIGVATASFEVLTPIAGSMSSQLESYTKFATGFVTMWGGSTVGVSYFNPFHPQDFPGHYPLNITKALPFNEDNIVKISSMEGVKAVYRVVIMSAAYIPPEEEQERLLEERRKMFPNLPISDNLTLMVDMGLVGVEAEAAQAGPLPYANIEKGRFLRARETDTVVVSNLIEKNWGFTVGEEIPLIILKEERKLKIVGVYSGLLPTAMDPGDTVVMDLDALFRLLDVAPSEGRYNALLIGLREPSLAQSIVGALRRGYPQAQVHYQYGLAKTSIELLSSTANTYDLTRNLLLVVSATMIVLVRLIDLLRHRRELGLYVAIGWRERDLLKYMLWQSVIIGLMGATVGILFTVAMGGYLSEALIPERLKYTLIIPRQVPDPHLLPFALLIALALSTLTFAAGYLHFRRLTPLKMLEEA